MSDSVNLAHDVIEWHNILGHCNFDDVLKLENVVDGMKVIGDKVKAAVYDVCVQEVGNPGFVQPSHQSWCILI